MNALAQKKYYRSLNPLLNAAALNEERKWEVIFGREAPLELEIGFGNGEYLNRSSLADPERDFIGLEIAWSSLKRALRRLSKPSRSNVRIICLPARCALERLFLPKQLKTVRSLFPVPWPKDNHEKKRIFSTDFLNLVSNRLQNDGLFHMVTDNRILAEWTLNQSENSALKVSLEEKPAILNTKYERKWQQEGFKIFYHLSGHKLRHPQIVEPELSDMQAYYLTSLDPAHYSPKSLTGDPTVKFGEFIYDNIHQTGLLRVKIIEGQFIQDFYIRLTAQNDGRWKITPAIGGQIFPTEGVRLALSLAAENNG